MSEPDSNSSPDSDLVSRITAALAANRRVEAIKIFCEEKGVGLKDGKDFVEHLIPRLIEEDPERFGHLKRKSGCGSSAAVLLIIIAAATLLAVV